MAEYNYVKNLIDYYNSAKDLGFYTESFPNTVTLKAPNKDNCNNSIFLKNPKDKPDNSILDKYYGFRNYEICIEQEAILDGFKSYDKFPAMDMDIKNLKDPLSTKLVKKEIKELSELIVFNNISTKVYGVDYWDIIKPLLGYKNHKHFIAYDDDSNPVAICKTFAGENSVGLYFVAVPEEERRKGYAEELSLYALNQTVKEFPNIEVATLAAYEIAIPLYEKIGFKTVANFNVYLRDKNQK